MNFLLNIKPREYQDRISKTCLEKNCLVVLPTGLGKTLIGLLVVIERMKKFPGEKVLFLAPTRPLAEQHLRYFQKHLPELFAEIQLFTGSVKPEQRKKIWYSADIIFSTPQCIANDLKNEIYNLKEVCLLIEDEAHRCLKNYDYNYIASNYKKNSQHPRILGLTASPGSESSKIKEICRNLSIEEVELRTRESDDVKEYLQELQFERESIDFPEEFSEIRDLLKQIFEKYIEELKSRKLLFGFPTKTELIKLQKKISYTISTGNKNYNYLLGMSACAQAIKIQHALELLETQTLESFNNYMKNLFEQADKGKSKGVLKLVSGEKFRLAFKKSNIMLSKKIEHPKIKKIVDIVKKEREGNENAKILIFTQFRDTAAIIAKEINKLKSISAKVFIGQTMKNGEGLSQKEQKEIIRKFSLGEINVLCATCIGEEGLDIPEVNAVVFYEPVASAIRTIQRSGRTARLNKGKIIVLMTKKTKDETYYYVSKRKEKKMHEAIGSIREEMFKKRNLKDERQKTL